jgi:hypothetical protein
VVEPIGDDERQQHLDRAEHHQHEHAREQQGPQQPRGLQHEGESLTQIAQQLRPRLIVLCRSVSHRCPPGGQQQDQADAEQRGHHCGTGRRERGPHHQAGHRRADGPLEHRAHDPLDAVGGQQLFGRQDSRQDRAVGREEERRGDTQSGSGHRHMPDLQRTNESQSRDNGDDGGVDGRDDDDDAALVEPVGGQPTDQHERHQARREAGRDQRQ